MANITNVPSSYGNSPVSASISDTAIGLSLPIDKGPLGYFASTYTTIEQAKTNLQNLILTIPGERVMHPSLGSSLKRVLFEPVIDEESLTEVVDNLIRDDVETWLPYLNIDTLNVAWDENNHLVTIDLTISLKSDPTVKDTLYVAISNGDI